MIYLETNEKNVVVYIHYMPLDEKYGLGKTEEELKETGYLVDSVPEYSEEIPEGKRVELHYDGAEFSWVLVDIPPEPEPMPTYEELLTMAQAIERGMTV